LAGEADKQKLTDESAVVLTEMKAMRKWISGAGAKKAQLPPGSGIGPVRAKLPKRATDFVWCCFKLLASRRALTVLERAGIHVPHGPVVAAGTGAKTEYCALQLDPVALYSARTLTEMTLAFCPACGQCWMRDVNAKCKGPKEYVRRLMPEEQGLVKAREGGETLATSRFMDVVRSEKLTGMEFEESGVYV